MGDRTRVYMTILTAQEEQANAIWNGDPDDNWEYEGEIELIFEGCNYGNTGHEDDLIAAGIAFDKKWDAGGEYPAGHSTVRFTSEGRLETKEYDEPDCNPDLKACMDILDHKQLSDSDKFNRLQEYIRHHYNEVTPSYPLDEKQIAYGKIYRTIQLVKPKEAA